MRVCLDLFCGLGGFSAAFEDADEWHVVTVDIEDRFAPDVRADVLDLRPSDILDALPVGAWADMDLFVVVASPPCQYLNTAGNHDKWDFNAKQPTAPESRNAVALFHHAIGLIHAMTPDWWAVENPRASRIQWSFRPPDYTVTYCQYGTDYQKPTGIWGNLPPSFEAKSCQAGSDCHVTNTEHDGTEAVNSMPTDAAKRALVPYELSKSILHKSP